VYSISRSVAPPVNGNVKCPRPRGHQDQLQMCQTSEAQTDKHGFTKIENNKRTRRGSEISGCLGSTYVLNNVRIELNSD
jgi:hypothetical protein